MFHFVETVNTMSSEQQAARQAAAEQRWAAFPANVQQKLEELGSAAYSDESLENIQEWWAQNQGHLSVDAQVNEVGHTALYYASYHGHEEIARYLVGVCGANVNLKNEFNGWTPLMGAAVTNKPDCVLALLELGAEADLRGDEDGKTALELARERKFQECIDILEQWVPKTGS